MLGLMVWRVLQFGLLAGGTALSLWTLRRLCAATPSACAPRRGAWPFAVLAAVYTLALAVILSLPMASRL